MATGFVSDSQASQRTKQANDFARRFNALAEQHGFDLPMELLISLIELFGEAIPIPTPASETGQASAQTFNVGTTLTPKESITADSRQASAWQTMESAPKDGTIIDIWCSSSDGVDQWRETNCIWLPSRKLWANNAGRWDCATRWMLPLAPSEDETTTKS